MRRTIRLSMIASVSALAIVAAPPAVRAADPIDTARLPRIEATNAIYESAGTTIFVTRLPVAAAVPALTRALEAGGWKRYVAPFTATAENPNSAQLTFKKDDRAISAHIAVAPAQNNATTVQYAAMPLANDLPFPADATDIEFSPDRPHLIAKTGAPVGDAMAFFAREMTARGWSPWSTRTVARIPAGETVGEFTDGGGQAYFVRDGKSPLRLTLRRADDGRVRAEIEVVPAALLDPGAQRAAAEAARQREAAQRAAAEKEARERFQKEQQGFDQLAAGMVRDALAGVGAPPRQPQPAASDARPAARADAGAAVPVPDTAEGLQLGSGKLDYTSRSSVAALADFHRGAMKPLGWREQPTVINRPNMVALDFQKDGRKVTFTIMQFGASTKVSATGSGLVAAGPAGASPTESEPVVELAAAESAGLPVPKETTSVGSSKTPFRVEATAATSANMASVLAFYRRELSTRGWREETRGAEIVGNRARIEYTSPEGPAILRLERKRDATEISLTLRKSADVQKAGLAPKAGQGKVIFGNVMDTDSVITLAGKSVKIGAGVGEKAPDGPSMDLKPGKYRYSIKSGAKTLKGDEFTVAPGEVWGVLVGPGGGLTLQVY